MAPLPNPYAPPGPYPPANAHPYAAPPTAANSGQYGYVGAAGVPAAQPNQYVGNPAAPVPHPNAYSNAHPSLAAGPPRRAPSGRLANRLNGITMHQPSSTQPAAYATVPGGQFAYPQPDLRAQHPGSYMPPVSQGTNAMPPTMGSQPMSGGHHSIREPAGQFPSMSPLQNALPQQMPSQHMPPQHIVPQHMAPQHMAPQQGRPPQRPEFLIIGLFALRLTRQLVEQLDPYEGSESDLHWLDHFLKPYHPSYALAKLKDPTKIDNYTSEYPRTVRRIIKQPRYRKIFMQMNPDKKVTDRELTDEELLAIIDFADTASEWGSTVPLPGKYATRMEELAKGRRMAE